MTTSIVTGGAAARGAPELVEPTRRSRTLGAIAAQPAAARLRAAALGARARIAAATLALAAITGLVYGLPHPGYDTWFALAWGRELAHGQLPTLDAFIAPTPHPLANVVSAVVSVLGTRAPDAMALLSLLSFAAVGVAAYVLGRRLFSALAGVLFAAILLTRPSLVGQMLYCSIDIPFLALALGAGAAAVAPTPRPGRVIVALALAGLLRPEGWVLAAGYVLFAAHRGLVPRRWLALALAGPPALWAGFDLASTGDALHSLHGTQELTDRLDRPESVSTAINVIPQYLQSEVGGAIAYLGAIGALFALWRVGARTAMLLATLAAGIAVFLAHGVAGLPLLDRYLLLPGAVLACFCALILSGWRDGVDRSPRVRRLLRFGAVVAASVVALSAPADLRAISDQQLGAALYLTAQRDLARLLARPETQASIRRCGNVQVPHAHPVPQVSYMLDAPLSAVTIPPGAIERGVALDPVPGRQGANLRLGGGRHFFSAGETSGTRLVAYTGGWAARARC